MTIASTTFLLCISVTYPSKIIAANRRSTSAILKNLRSIMKDSKYVSEKFDAYVIPSGDAHQSEYEAECDKRLEYVSSFTGSRGLACMTEDMAALWTDGRFFLQAENELDENWTLMKEGLPETPTLVDWLLKTIRRGGRVGIDPHLITPDQYTEWSKSLRRGGLFLSANNTQPNLVDIVWGAERPKAPSGPVFPLELSFAGKPWQQKIDEMRATMKQNNVNFLVLSALDEVAWLFNLRGSDIPYCPVFFAYAIVGTDTIDLFIDDAKLTSLVRDRLKPSDSHHRVEILPYNAIIDRLVQYRDEYPESRYWLSRAGTSLALAQCIPEDRTFDNASPVILAKAQKNPVEMQGMKNCHIKDAVAHCEFLHWLEREIQKRELTEYDVAKKFEELRRMQEDFVGLSFEIISAAGPNSAMPHYKPPATRESSGKLVKSRLFLVDSGGQYRDGTTDVTRTIAFAEPSSYQKECFTRVLKGHIALATLRFPEKTTRYQLHSISRTSLWDVGLDFLHGAGHGVGHFLIVHEAPAGSGFSTRPDLFDDGIRENMVLTIEPGYYEDGDFGVRIENCYAIVEAETKYRFQNVKFLTFEPLTLVPIQKRLIELDLLTRSEIDWLNRYHARIYETLTPIFENKGRSDMVEWLREQTAPLGGTDMFWLRYMRR